MTRLAIRGGTVVAESGALRADLIIEDGLIEAIVEPGDGSVDEEIDSTGLLVLPGGVDVHTHMDSPSGKGHTTDTHLTGTRAAAAGGTTTVVDFAPQSAGETLPALAERWSEKMAGECAIDYSFHATVSSWYDGITDDMGRLVDAGISSFKVYMAYKGAVMIDDGQLFQVLSASAEFGSRVCIHAENGDVIDVIADRLVSEGKVAPRYHLPARPGLTEAEAVHRALVIAELTGGYPYLVHMSAAESLDHIRRAKERGVPVVAETCTHYLTLDQSVYDSDDFDVARYVLTPPIKSQRDRDCLWGGIADGTLSIVSSDHCPLCLVGQKDLGKGDFRDIPNGGPGVENRVLVLFSEGVAQNRITLERFVEIVSTEPARAFGLYPKKGVIAQGSDADLLILDPNGMTDISASAQYQNVDYNLWEGWELKGRINKVLSRGVVVASDGEYVGPAGHGEFIPRKAVAR